MPHILNPQKIYQELLNVAYEDGVVSLDEKNLIESVTHNIEKYYQILDEYYEDGIITSEEQHNLYSARKETMNDAIEVAKSDKQITSDEFMLLKTIKKILEDLAQDEHY